MWVEPHQCLLNIHKELLCLPTPQEDLQMVNSMLENEEDKVVDLVSEESKVVEEGVEEELGVGKGSADKEALLKDRSIFYGNLWVLPLLNGVEHLNIFYLWRRYKITKHKSRLSTLNFFLL